jgi:GNAT superfamily N-acetyltransferase
VTATVHLRPARPGEEDLLCELCLRSKAVWGYDAAFLDACRLELRPKATVVAAGLVQVAEIGGRVAGCAEISVSGEAAHLEKLFVEPGLIGSGIGALLMDWAADEAARLGAREMMIEADPGAVPFYRRRGAREAGTVPSGSIPGRFLPKLVLDLHA